MSWRCCGARSAGSNRLSAASSACWSRRLVAPRRHNRRPTTIDTGRPPGSPPCGLMLGLGAGSLRDELSRCPGASGSALAARPRRWRGRRQGAGCTATTSESMPPSAPCTTRAEPSAAGTRAVPVRAGSADRARRGPLARRHPSLLPHARRTGAAARRIERLDLPNSCWNLRCSLTSSPTSPSSPRSSSSTSCCPRSLRRQLVRSVDGARRDAGTPRGTHAGRGRRSAGAGRRSRRPQSGRHRLAAHDPRQSPPLASRSPHRRARAVDRVRPP